MPLESLKSNTPNFSSVHWPIWVVRPHESISRGLVTDKRGIRRIDLPDDEAEFTVRRLHAKNLKDYPLYPLGKIIWSLKDLLASGHLCFIDMKGKIYKYKKTTFYPLVYKEIISRKATSNSTIFTLKGVHHPFEVKGKLNLHAKYAGVIKIDKSYLLYEVTNEKLKDSRRKI
jgi:hypothetical protein